MIAARKRITPVTEPVFFLKRSGRRLRNRRSGRRTAGPILGSAPPKRASEPRAKRRGSFASSRGLRPQSPGEGAPEESERKTASSTPISAYLAASNGRIRRGGGRPGMKKGHRLRRSRAGSRDDIDRGAAPSSSGCREGSPKGRLEVAETPPRAGAGISLPCRLR